jgi:PAS domain-containing protein
MPAPKRDPQIMTQSEATFAMDSTPDRCVLLDGAGCIVQANEAWSSTSRQTDVVPLENAREGADYMAAMGRAALNGNREAGSMHAQIRKIQTGGADRARLEFDRPLRTGGVVRTVATIEQVTGRDQRLVLVAFTTEVTKGAVRPTVIPEAGFSVPAGTRFERLTEALEHCTAHAAVLDGEGRIVAVNAAWRRFTMDTGGDPARTGVGVDYLAVCSAAAKGGDGRANRFLRELQAVLRGERHTFTADARVGTGGEARPFRGRATALNLEDGVFVLVTHTYLDAARTPTASTVRTAA